jgi:hypothetical protein
VKPISLCELSRVQVPVVTSAGSAMVLLLRVLPVGRVGIEASSVEASTNCCVQYKHAFACFLPRSGTFLQKLEFYWM